MALIEHMQLDFEEEENVTVVNPVPYQEVTETTLDLENYINNYKGFAKYLRLIFIARRCRPLRLDALCMALNWLKETWNFVEYTKLFNIISTVVREERDVAESALSIFTPGICCRDDCNFQRFQTRVNYDPIHLNDGRILIYDSDWVDRTRRISNQTLDQLDTDLKNYKANSLAESIRRGCDELATINTEIGDLLSANRNYTRSRDYCKTDSHELTMCMNVIRISIYLGNWRHVASYIDRAVTLLENIPSNTNQTPLVQQLPDLDDSNSPPLHDLSSASLSTGGESNLTNNTVYMPNNKRKSTDKVSKNAMDYRDSKNRSKALLNCVKGLLELRQRNFVSAARNFLQVDHDHINFNNILTTNDVALYGTFCGLATFDRASLKTNVINNTNFKQFLENEPVLREIVYNFYNFHYTECLRAMATIKNQLLLDIYLADHVEFLYKEIRNRALCQYFSPYKQAHLSRIADCFNTSVQSLINDELRPLICSGQLKAKIDSQHQLLVATTNDDLHHNVYQRACNLVHNYHKRMTIACVINACIRSDIYRGSTNPTAGTVNTVQQQNIIVPATSGNITTSSSITASNSTSQSTAQNFGDIQMDI